MQKIKFFMFKGCPHCAKAQKYLDELRAENPAYRELIIEKIDERLQPELANSYDYYYVPTFFVGEKKIFEGSPALADVRGVLEEALR